ncbi:unnamed protein product [Trichobilharzia szidati]|nr:unnamed protein product [Trichobilharzia szidati]
MDSGCKGSVKLSVCDVIVHSSDARRFDLILGEQRYYLRALSRSDRQRWVVALGNSKVGNVPLKCEDVNVCEPSQAQSIDSHRSELRLYHNLMVQQVKEIQNNLKEDKIPDMNRINELTSMLNASCSTFLLALDELMILSNAQAPWLSSIVTGTNLEPSSPKTFRNTTTTAAITMTSSPTTLTITDSTGQYSPNLRYTPNHHHNNSNNLLGYTSSPLLPPDSCFQNSRTQSINRRQFSASRKYQTFFSTLEYSFEDIRPSLPVMKTSSSSAATTTPSSSDNDEIKLPGDYISALELVKASKCLFSFLDRLNNNTSNSHFAASRTYTALQQVRRQLIDYLHCIEVNVEVYANAGAEDEREGGGGMNGTMMNSVKDTAAEKRENGGGGAVGGDIVEKNNCDILFKKAQLSIGYLIRNEVKAKTSQEENSVYHAILHLCRCLNFIREFLHHLFRSPDPSTLTPNSDASLVTIANEAYTRCLRPFHSWSVRGMAMVIIQSLPSRLYLLDLLLLDNPESLPESFNESPLIRYPESYIQLKLDAARFAESLGRFLTLIEGLLASLDLNRIFTGSECY